MKEHIHYIDALKGGAILLVILGHCIDLNYDLKLGSVYASLWNFIYTFHMGLFMFLSGMTRKIEKKNFTETVSTIKKRTIRLIIPFFAWGIITTLTTNNTLYEIFKFPDRGLWFLIALYIICLIFDISQYLSYKYKKKLTHSYFYPFHFYYI